MFKNLRYKLVFHEKRNITLADEQWTQNLAPCIIFIIGTTCISCKFGHQQVATIALVTMLLDPMIRNNDISGIFLSLRQFFRKQLIYM